MSDMLHQLVVEVTYLQAYKTVWPATVPGQLILDLVLGLARIPFLLQAFAFCDDILS